MLRGMADGVAQCLLHDAEGGDLHTGSGGRGRLDPLQHETDLHAGASDGVDEGRHVVQSLLRCELGMLVLRAEHPSMRRISVSEERAVAAMSSNSAAASASRSAIR